MANNPDIIGQIVDKLMKTANKTADDITLRYRDRLMILKQRAKDLGLNLNDLVERDENGVPTGNMITPPAEPTQTGNEEDDFIYNAYMKDLNEVPAVHYGSWEKARDEFKKQAWEDFKTENPDWEGMSGFARGYKWDEYLRPKMKQWNKQNSIKVEVLDENGETKYIKWVPNKIYESSQWEELKKKYPNRTSNNDSLERWIKDYRQIKNELDSMLPVGSTTSYRLPQFRGTFMNSVRNQMNVEEGTFKRANAFRKTFGRRVVLESFIETSEDYDYGSLNTMNSPEEELLGTKLNYEEERTERLPLFGINKLENMQDLSSDLCGSMVAYASMATSYQCLDNVVDALEVGRQALYNRNIRGKDNFADKAGRIMSGKLGSTSRNPSGNDEAYLEGSKNRAYGRYIKFLDNQVYGVTAKYWGIPIGKGKRLLFNKIMQNLTSLAGFSFLQGNILGGTVNTITGFNNIFKEAVTGDYFDAKDWAFAHKYYFSRFVDLWCSIGDISSLKKQTKLGLFLEQMNTGSNNRDKFRSWHTTRSRINNFFRSVGYLPYSSGDHYMQAMSYLAVAHGTKLYDADGTLSTNLWDAFERTQNVDDEGNQPVKHELIKNGILTGYLIDDFNGRRMNEPGNGASRRQSYKYEPTSRMSNTYIAPGKSTPEEIIKNTKLALYAVSFGGGSVNPATGEFNFGCSEAYIVKDGKITEPVRGATLVGNARDILMHIDMVGNDLALGQGMCGSASGSIPVNVGQPTIRVDEIVVGGRGGSIYEF